MSTPAETEKANKRLAKVQEQRQLGLTGLPNQEEHERRGVSKGVVIVVCLGLTAMCLACTAVILVAEMVK